MRAGVRSKTSAHKSSNFVGSLLTKLTAGSRKKQKEKENSRGAHFVNYFAFTAAHKNIN